MTKAKYKRQECPLVRIMSGGIVEIREDASDEVIAATIRGAMERHATIQVFIVEEEVEEEKEN